MAWDQEPQPERVRQEDRMAVEAVRRSAHPSTGDAAGYGRLMELIGDSRLVLLGEASHGTHEFYRARAEITKRLIEDKGFTAVVVEADWPDAYRVNRYVRGMSYTAPQGRMVRDETAAEALGDFRRFLPYLDVAERRRAGRRRLAAGAQRRAAPGRPKAGFYGMDLYSLYGSLEAVVRYLDKVDPEAAGRARARYACFGQFEKESQAYGYAAHAGVIEPCEDEVVAQLVELQRRVADYARRDGRYPEDEYFFAEQNARVTQNAERYYRAMFRGQSAAWNLRDRHMVETLRALVAHLDGRAGWEGVTKVAVWAHNSHLGDARATEAAERGQLNVGQLVREQWGQDAFLVGFSTYAGTVTAASEWDEPAERKRVRPGLPGSYEALCHDTGVPRFVLPLRDGSAAAEALRTPRLERFIGVIYRPETERWSHYYHADLPRQFDALLFFDQTRAVEPLERTPGWQRGQSEAPETYPSAL